MLWTCARRWHQIEEAWWVEWEDLEVKLLDGTITAGGPLYELMLNRVEQMKDMKYNLEQDGDILEDRRDKVLHQQTQGEEIISIN